MSEHQVITVKTLHKRYEMARDQVKRVQHIHDRDFMGRPPTAGESADFAKRTADLQKELAEICKFPCLEVADLRSKARVINLILNDGVALCHSDQRALIQSILQMTYGRKL